ncbi:M23 family metallopeptidase [Nocardioides sp. SR21]|uniref:M23 family metallopeptidase n=1 Tax=Nocardioides sp. SR21 TaxID=2919501 RepID=UPI001FA9D97E|nr:M23 family metallopeptidase [Nocardioides sp. SR21]
MPDPSTDAVAAGSWFGLHTVLTALAVGAVTYVGFTGAQLFHTVSPDTPSAVAVADPPPLAAPPVATPTPEPEPSRPAPSKPAKPSRSEARPAKPAAPPSPAATPAARPDKAGRAPLAARKQPTTIQRETWADRQIAAMLRTMPPSPMSWFTGGATWVLPTTGYHLTARFGESGSHWSSTHTGLDFAAPTGTPVRAATGGTVSFAGWDGAYGNKIEITHPDGTETWYAHLSQLYVAEGNPVATGTVVGEVGGTGNVTGPHLHFEIRSGDVPLDPYTALQQRGLRP